MIMISYFPVFNYLQSNFIMPYIFSHIEDSQILYDDSKF